MTSPRDRSAGAASRSYAFGPFRVDVLERRLTRDGTEVALTNKAFDVLLMLVEGAGRLQTREHLIQSLWQGIIVEEHGLTGYLSMVRKALGDTGPDAQYIETVRGHGYRFVAPVDLIGGHASDATGPPTMAAAGAPNDADPARTNPASSPAANRVSKVGTRQILLLCALALALGLAGAVLVRTEKAALSAVAAPPSSRALAILPFENLGPDKNIDYFVSGVQNIVAVKLAGIADLRVVSQSSTTNYASRPSNLAAVADELGVANLLEGSVQKAGDQVLISVQLVEGRSGKTIWAQAYTRTLDDAFRVESEIAEQVAKALRVTVMPLEATRVASTPTMDTQAYTLFLQADYAAWQLENWGVWGTADTADILNRSVDLYRQAIQRDGTFALAFARLSYLQSYAYWTYVDHTAQRIADAENAAQRALALAPDLPQARLAMGYVLYYGQREYAAALAQFEQATHGLPNDAEIIGAVANIERRQGRLKEALANYERASTLDPRNSNWLDLIADTEAMSREYAKAREAYDRAEAIDPKNYYALVNRAQMFLLSGEPESAMAALQKIPQGAGPLGVTHSMRYQIALLERQPALALKELDDAPDWVDNPWMIGSVPVSLLRAFALDLNGGDATAKARLEYQKADRLLEVALRGDPRNPMWESLRGLTQVGLGHADEGIRWGKSASAQVSVQKDAYDGPHYLMTLAQIEAQAGHVDESRAIIRQLLAMPAGLAISGPLVARDPRFRALTDDPGFVGWLNAERVPNQ